MRIRMLKQVVWAFDHIHPTVLHGGEVFTVGEGDMTEAVANALLADKSAVSIGDGERGIDVGGKVTPPEAKPPRRPTQQPKKRV